MIKYGSEKNQLFTPPYCPNPACPCHEVQQEESVQLPFFVRRGKKKEVQQFLCNECGRSFSESTFRLSYYEKKTLDYNAILASCGKDISLKDWAARMGTTGPTLKIRLYKLLWILVDRLEDKMESNKISSEKAADLLVECQLRLAEGREHVFSILRDLIYRFKKLLAEKTEEGRLLLHKLKQTLLIKLRLLFGQWSYALGENLRRWCPFHPME